MTEDDIIIWLSNIIDNCYSAKYDDYDKSIFFIYDENYVRKKKLSKINNIPVNNPIFLTGKCLFELYKKNLIIDYQNIWGFVENNYSNKYDDIQRVIQKALKIKLELNKFSTGHYSQNSDFYYNMTSDFKYSMKDIINNLDNDK